MISVPYLHDCSQGSFCECAQPMRDDVTRRLSLDGRIHKMIPGFNNDCIMKYRHNWVQNNTWHSIHNIQHSLNSQRPVVLSGKTV